jgi:peptidyl-tRNA hydrolase
VFAAAARGVIAMLDDHRNLPGGAWHDAIASWNGARIRKIMRRARGAAWEKAQAVPGLTVLHDTAQVRIFVPGYIDEAPPELAKLQIQSTPLDEPGMTTELTPPERATLTIALNPGVDMSWGKRAAQVAHAAQRCWETFDRNDRLDWNADGRLVRIIHPSPKLWDTIRAESSTTIRDGGFTEVEPGTLTAAAHLDRPTG